MEKRSGPTSGVFHYLRYLGFVFAILGIPAMMFDDSSSSEIPLLVGLFMMLVTAEKIEDERSVQIRTTSLYFAFIISYSAKLLMSNLFDHGVIPFELVDINHFMILTLVLANAMFYGRVYVLKH
jgi:hypothetical protein